MIQNLSSTDIKNKPQTSRSPLLPDTAAGDQVTMSTNERPEDPSDKILATLIKNLKCVFCREIMVEPQTLGCPHMMCVSCVDTAMVTSHWDCPTCRQFIMNRYNCRAVSNAIRDYFDTQPKPVRDKRLVLEDKHQVNLNRLHELRRHRRKHPYERWMRWGRRALGPWWLRRRRRRRRRTRRARATARTPGEPMDAPAAAGAGAGAAAAPAAATDAVVTVGS